MTAISPPPNSKLGDVPTGSVADLRELAITLLVPVLDFGGVETRIRIQSEAMRSSFRRFTVCTFWKAGRVAEQLREVGIDVHVLGIDPSIRNPLATKAALRFLRETRPDILHTCIGEANLHGLVAGTLAGIPMRVAEEVGVPERSGVADAVYSAAFRLAHRVIGVSDATCRYLAAVDHVAGGRLRAVYNCAPAEYFEGAPPDRRRPRGEPFRVLMVGRLTPEKNHDTMLRAFAALRNGGVNAELLIAGDGPLRSELESTTRRLGIATHTHFLGFRDDVARLLLKADLFVLPSRTEGLSIALVEAMASAIPVLGSTHAGIVEVMGELGDEYTIPAEAVGAWTSAMQRMAEMSPDQRRTLGLRARDVAVRRYSPTVYTRSLESLYRELALERRVQ